MNALSLFFLIAVVNSEATVLVQDYLPVAAYESVTVSDSGRYVIASYGNFELNIAGYSTYSVLNGARLGYAVAVEDYFVSSSRDKRIFALAFDNRTSGSSSVAANVCDIASCSTLLSVNFPNSWNAKSAMSDDGKIMVSTVNLNASTPAYFYSSLAWYDITSRRQLGQINVYEASPYLSLAVSGDGSTVAGYNVNGSIIIARVVSGHTYTINVDGSKFCMSGDGNTIVAGSDSVQVFMYDDTVNAYLLVWQASGPDTVPFFYGCALSKSNHLAVTFSGQNGKPSMIQMFKLATGTSIWSYTPDKSKRTYDMAISDDGVFLAAASDKGSKQLTVFRTSSNVPYFSLDTAGTIFDVDIGYDSNSNSYIVAGVGYHSSSDDGDLYIVKVK